MNTNFFHIIKSKKEVSASGLFRAPAAAVLRWAPRDRGLGSTGTSSACRRAPCPYKSLPSSARTGSSSTLLHIVSFSSFPWLESCLSQQLGLLLSLPIPSSASLMWCKRNTARIYACSFISAEAADSYVFLKRKKKKNPSACFKVLGKIKISTHFKYWKNNKYSVMQMASQLKI